MMYIGRVAVLVIDKPGFLPPDGDRARLVF